MDAEWTTLGVHVRDLERALRDAGVSISKAKFVVASLKRAAEILETWPEEAGEDVETDA